MQTSAPIEQKTVQVDEDELTVACLTNGRVYIPIRPICSLLHINWDGQRQRIRRDPFLSAESVVFTLAVATDETAMQGRAMVCLPLEILNYWLSTIHIGRTYPDAREFVIKAQQRMVAQIASQLKIQVETRSSRRNASELIEEKSAFVYLIQAVEGNGTQHYKIGYTTMHPLKYIARLSGRSPLPLSLQHTIQTTERNGRNLEKQLHKRYASERTHHEWFRLTAQQVAEIKTL